MPLSSSVPTTLRNDLNTAILFCPEQAAEENGLTGGRTLLPEWFPQSGIQISWPHEDTDWMPMLQEVTECYLRLAFAIASREPLLITTPQPEALKKLLREKMPQNVCDRIRVVACPTNDTWVRDYGFLTVLHETQMELLDFRFRGWGGKFEAEKDNAVNRHILSEMKGTYVDCLDYELEGGSIETDGRGTLLTTSRCLCNTNRNGGLTKAQCEAALSERLGVNRFLWLDHGYLAGDDTDSHIDTLARLAPDDTIIYIGLPDADDEHFEELHAMREELRAFRTAEGKPFRLLELPFPDAIYAPDGERLPATYANYLILNRAVLYPTYAQPEHDQQAAAVLAQAFPHHDIVGVDCRPLIRQHGSLHCATMQYPRTILNF